MASFREKLKAVLSEHELKILKTSFDVVGDIAILEIDDALSHREKLIAKTLLDSHKNINTVLKKAGEHSGRFRTQKMKFLAGEDKRIGEHKELSSKILVDVENVYFSPRLSTERKRIMEQVRPGENILVMFSGAGPYPIVISKNTKARRVVGIEINPVGYRLAKESVRKNKLKNVDLYKGDVKKIVPMITRKAVIGPKSSWKKDHLKTRLQTRQDLIEIYIGSDELEEDFDDFYSAIKSLSKTMKVVLHAPHFFNGTEVSPFATSQIVSENTKVCFDLMEKTCRQLNLHGFVGHCYSVHEKSKRYAEGKPYSYRIRSGNDFFTKNSYRYLFLENMPFGPFSRPRTIIPFSRKNKVNLCIDTAHMYQGCLTTEEFYGSFTMYDKQSTYYHLVDARHMGVRDIIDDHCNPVGEGEIDFDRIVPNVLYGCAEIKSESELDPKEMMDSLAKLKKTADDLCKFDRILMPLPKSAEDFLPVALSAVKKGGVIHFYDFLHQDDFHLAEQKARLAVKKAGFKFRKLGFSKCGQHSPRTFRVCLDFQVM